MVDWMWELAVLPAVFLALAAVVVAGGIEVARPRRRSRSTSFVRHHGERLAIAALSVAALIAISLPLASAAAIQRSQDEVAGGDLDGALADAREAVAVQPYAAAPRIQEALVLEEQGRLAPAAAAARDATRRESANWSNWLILSRLEARTGHARASLEAYRKARSLNPGSGIFVQ
jgi:tetratricopeptide (TPR) repeat protein